MSVRNTQAAQPYRAPVRTIRNQHRGDLSRPPVDELTSVTGGAFALVNVVSKRARQLTAYESQLGEGVLQFTGPLVTVRRDREQPLSVALREVHQGLLDVTAIG